MVINLNPTAAQVVAPIVVTDPLLREGASGSSVEHLQKLLNAKGATLVVDGDFGNATKMAVRKFQNDKGLVEDGVVGQQTWAVLKA